MSEIKIKQDSKKVFLLFILSVFMLLLAIFSIKNEGFPVNILSSILALFFAFSLFYSLRRLITNRSSLIINENGFIDNSSTMSAGFVPWSNVIMIDTEITSGQYITVFVANTEEYKSLLEKNRRAFKKFIVKDNAFIMHIDPGLLEMKCEDIFKIMESYFSLYREKNISA